MPGSQEDPSGEPATVRGPGRDRAVSRVLWIVLGVNVVVAAAKLTVGLLIGALALVADGLHSALDASSNVVGLVGMAIARRPADAGHPYGHRRFEPIAAAVIGLLIALGLFGILERILNALVDGREAPRVTVPAVAVVVATIVVNLGISFYERRRGRVLRSSLLVADSGHTLSDALAALVILVSFAAVAFGLGWADLVAAAIVCVVIGHTAYVVLRTNLGVLADGVQLDPEAIHRVVLSVPGVRAAHRIRSRGPSDHVHVDLHVHVDPQLSVTEAHAKTHEVADAIREAFPEVVDVVIHTEPAGGREQQPASPAPDADG